MRADGGLVCLSAFVGTSECLNNLSEQKVPDYKGEFHNQGKGIRVQQRVKPNTKCYNTTAVEVLL